MLVTKDWRLVQHHTVSTSGYSFVLSIEQDRYISITPSQVGSRLTNETDTCASEWILPEQEITRLLVASFKQIPEVTSIHAQFGSDGITIWTLLQSYDRVARGKVYERELEICDRLRVYDFDFRVSAIDVVAPAELIKAGSREIFKRH